MTKIEPFENAKSHFLDGLAHLKQKRFREAEQSFEKSLQYIPDRASTLTNLSVAKIKLHKLQEARELIMRSLAIEPNNPEGYLNLGTIHLEQKNYSEAIACFDRAHELNGQYIDALINKGNALGQLKKNKEVVETFELALKLQPDYNWLLGMVLHAKMKICDWRNFDESLNQLKVCIQNQVKAVKPWTFLSLVDDPVLQKQSSEIFIKAEYPELIQGGRRPKKETNTKLRIAYFSADFHNHATSYLMAELFEMHEKSTFELHGFSFGPKNKDEMQFRVMKAFEYFHEVSEKSDEEIAEFAKKLNLDIAIDLKGYTEGARTGIFAKRCAPVQVNYLGYPGTMGADFMDYIIADRELIPLDMESNYSERVYCLPGSYQVNDRQRKISQKATFKAEFGLPDTGFIFCCFNNNFKINPHVFDLWMLLLKKVAGSVLWLLEDNSEAKNNLIKEAQARGVDRARLVFAPRMRLDEHLSRHKHADLFIDTFPYNAHTTCSDALWAGLPVLTMVGQSFASRVSASLLKAVHMPELIAQSENDYIERAVSIAQNPSLLSELKTKLANNRLTCPLFDTRTFVKEIESAYKLMVNSS
jgi:predicted O-linked N-acetylglucosamine transferase (SPINDLY family)